MQDSSSVLSSTEPSQPDSVLDDVVSFNEYSFAFKRAPTKRYEVNQIEKNLGYEKLKLFFIA